MSYRVKNTALDHTRRFLHRRAPKMQMEPVIDGRRLRLRSSLIVSDELFEHNRANLELWRGWGIVDWERVGGEKPGKTVNGHYIPSKEEVLRAGYSEENADRIIERETRAAVPAAVVPAPGEYRVWLAHAGGNQIGVVRAVREGTSLSIKEVNDLLGTIPAAVLSDVDEATANRLASALGALGAQVQVQKRGEQQTPPEPVLEETAPEPPPAEATPAETKPQPTKNQKGKKQ